MARAAVSYPQFKWHESASGIHSKQQQQHTHVAYIDTHTQEAHVCEHDFPIAVIYKEETARQPTQQLFSCSCWLMSVSLWPQHSGSHTQKKQEQQTLNWILGLFFFGADDDFKVKLKPEFQICIWFALLWLVQLLMTAGFYSRSNFPINSKYVNTITPGYTVGESSEDEWNANVQIKSLKNCLTFFFLILWFILMKKIKTAQRCEFGFLFLSFSDSQRVLLQHVRHIINNFTVFIKANCPHWLTWSASTLISTLKYKLIKLICHYIVSYSNIIFTELSHLCKRYKNCLYVFTS